MKQLERRILAIETANRRTLGTRYFSGFEHTGKYFESGTRRPNHRFGLNGEDEEGPSFTAADIAELESQGWECVVISIVYVDWRPSGNMTNSL